MSEKKPTDGKLVFSNPPQPNSAFASSMKKVSDVPAFSGHLHATKASGAKFSMPEVAVYQAPDITVTAQNPLIITGSGPVSVSFGTVTIEPGGQIFVYTAADIKIDTLIKQ